MKMLMKKRKLISRMWIIPALVFITVLIPTFNVFADTMTLVNGDTANVALVKPVGCSDIVSKAATELQTYINKMTSVTVPIYTSDQTPSETNWILIGISSKTQELGISSVSEGQDGFIIGSFYNNRIILAGADDKSTTYAVYEFMKTYLGCWVHYPTNTGLVETVPTTPTLTLTTPIDIKMRPDCAYRDFVDAYFSLVTDKTKTYEWASKNKLSSMGASEMVQAKTISGDMYQYGLNCSSAVHSLWWFLPSFSKDDYNFLDYAYSQTQGYYDVHKEYFPQIPANQDPLLNRIRPERPSNNVVGNLNSIQIQLCFSNPNVVAIVSDNIKDYISRFPNITEIALTQNDGDGWCQCAACMAMDDTNDPVGSHSTRYYKFANQVVANVVATYPNVKIKCLAYGATRSAPIGITIDPHINVGFALGNRCYKHAIDDPNCPINASLWSDFQNWVPLTDKMYFYDYPRWEAWIGFPDSFVNSTISTARAIRKGMNRVNDFSFENTATGWATDTQSGTYSYSIDTSGAYDGSKCAKIVCTSAGAGRFYQYNIPVIQGGKYKLRVKVKTSSAFSGAARCVVVNGGTSQEVYLTTSTNGQWQELYIENIIPNGTSINLYLQYQNGTGTVWFDKAEISGEYGVMPELDTNFHSALKLYYEAWTRSLWDTEVSASTVISDFCNKYYGSAGSAMANFWTRIETASSNMTGCLTRAYISEVGALLTTQVKSDLNTYLTQAEIAATTEPFKSRVAEDRYNFNEIWNKDYYKDATNTSYMDGLLNIATNSGFDNGTTGWAYDSQGGTYDYNTISLINRVNDPSFENSPSEWSTDTQSGIYSYSIDTTGAYDGSRCAKIVCTTAGAGRFYQYNIPVIQGGKYRFKVRVKTTSTFSGAARCVIGNSGTFQEVYITTGTNGQWQEMYIDNIVPNGTSLELYLQYQNGTGMVWFDSAEVQEVSDIWEGNSAVKIQCTQYNNGIGRWYAPSISVSSGTAYQIKVRYKTLSDFIGDVFFQTYDGTYNATGNKKIYAQPTNGQWKEVNIHNIVPTNNSLQLLLTHNGSAGTVIFDSVQVVPEWITAQKLFQQELSSNMLTNPGFENGITDWGQDIAAGSFTYPFPIDTVEYFEGSKSVKLECTSSYGWARVYRTGISVDPSKKYKLKLRCKTDSTLSDATINIVTTDGYAMRVDMPPTDGQWEQIEMDISPTTNTMNLYLNLTVNSGTGAAWFDDVSLVEQ